MEKIMSIIKYFKIRFFISIIFYSKHENCCNQLATIFDWNMYTMYNVCIEYRLGMHKVKIQNVQINYLIFFILGEKLHLYNVQCTYKHIYILYIRQSGNLFCFSTN